MRLTLLCAVLLAGVAPVAQAAAPDVLDLRVGKLEKEMHAVQRRVFPSGAPVEPELVAAGPAVAAGSAASAPLADVTQRVDLLEAQVKTLTGQVEQYNIRLKKLEDAAKGYDGRLKALEPAAAEAPTPDAKPAVKAPLTKAAPPKSGATARPLKTAAAKSAKPAPAVKAVASVKPAADKKRDALVAAVPVPDTGDAAEDSYTYGYRLFDAKLYPEAQVKLTEFVTKYPKSKRYTFAQNLLGRSYFEEGKYANAAKAFVENYTKAPKGERAAESLSWAGVALNKDGLPAKACRVYQEFDDVYGAKATKDAQARVAKGRVDAKCPG
jgi:TolA-binding protein